MQFHHSTPSPEDSSLPSLRLPSELPTSPSRLRDLIIRISTPSDGVEPRDLVRVLVSLFDKLQDSPILLHPSVVSLLAFRLAWQLREIHYHDRAKATALMSRSGVSILDGIRDEVLNSLDSYSPPQLVQVLRAFAVAGARHERLFREISYALQPVIRDMSIEQRCHVAWSYATLGVSARPLYKGLVEATKATLFEYAPENTATTMWAFARMGIADRSLYQKMLHVAKRDYKLFTPQSLANVAWAQAETGIRDSELLAQIAENLLPGISDIHLKALPYVVWTFASEEIAAPRLFDAVVSRLEGRLGTLSLAGLVKFVWALSRADMPNEEILAEASHFIYDRMEELRGPHVATVAWAFGNVGYRDDKLLSALAEKLIDEVGFLDTPVLISTIWAFGNLGFRHEGLFREVSRIVARDKKSWPAKQYATAVWSIAEVHPEMLAGIIDRTDLDGLGYDASGWIQVYNALLIAGVVSPSEVFPAYERMRDRLIVGSSNRFELDVGRTVRDILADRAYTMEPQKIIGGVVTDWYIEVNGKKFAIECDGLRHHVLIGPDGGVEEGGERWVAPARDYAQDRILRLFGVTPIHVLLSTFYSTNGDVPTLVSTLRSSK